LLGPIRGPMPDYFSHGGERRASHRLL